MAHRASSTAVLFRHLRSFLSVASSSVVLPMNETRYRRISGALPNTGGIIDGLWDLFAVNYFTVLERPPVVVAVDESIWRLTHVIDDPAERIVMTMPRKPAGIGALAYLLATKQLYSELPFCVIG